jgi:hypothetical protein
MNSTRENRSNENRPVDSRERDATMAQQQDDALAARLRAAGEHLRRQRAPAPLQARLDRAYARHHAARTTWHWPRVAAACALASCLGVALLWNVRGDDDARTDQIAHTAPAAERPTIPPGRDTPPPAQAATPGNGSPDIAHIAARGGDRQAPRDLPWPAIAAPVLRSAPAPTRVKTLATATVPAADGEQLTDLQALPRLPDDALPALSLDVSALRIATTAPTLPTLSMQMPDGASPTTPAMPASRALEDGAEGDAPAVQPPPSQAAHAVRARDLA